MLDRDYEFIRELVYHHSRINLGPDKKELVSARLGKRLRATQLTSIGDYCRFLQDESSAEELSHLIDAISTNHTYFFREPAHFEFLTGKALPDLLSRRSKERWPTLNLWSAACSTGEEPYSIAIALSEELDHASPPWPWRIEATDISHRVLQRARVGVYREEGVSKVPANLLRSSFQKGFGPQEGNYRIKSSLQERVTFRQLNLLEGAPPFREPFQIIFCRNVMIYFDRQTQEELIQRLSRLLVPGGYLMVGHSESLSGIRHGLKLVSTAVYQNSL
jgi:chemotaxis protein methyltransferase CheR